MNCGWPMYRAPYGKSFRYSCGYYQQSHGAQCAHNHADGPTATRFMLGCLRQRLLSPTLLPKMEQRFRELAAQEQDNLEADRAIAELRAELAGMHADLKMVSDNLARAKTDAQYDAISTTFDELSSREALLGERIAEQESRAQRPGNVDTEIAEALNIVRRLADLVAKFDGPEGFRPFGSRRAGDQVGQRPALPAVPTGASQEAAAQQDRRRGGHFRRGPAAGRNLPWSDRASGPKRRWLDDHDGRRAGQARLVLTPRT